MPYCSSCGNEIPEGQGSSCSMCYGDMSYGRDGYYEQWAREREAEEDRAIIQQQLQPDSGQARRRLSKC